MSICRLLVLSPRPLKAKDIASVLSPDSGGALTKRDVNPRLYELMKYGIVSCDGESRWSINPAAVVRGATSNEFSPTVDPEAERRTRELGPRPISAHVGHWAFTLGREPSTGREVWHIECDLCGYRFGCRVQNHQQVYPLTGNLRDRRRRHDRTTHPERSKEQTAAENLILGTSSE